MISALLSFLANYTQFHFQTEEELFDKYGWPIRKVPPSSHGLKYP